MEVRMRKFWIAGVAALAIAGSTAVYAQHQRHWFQGQMRMNPQDRAAFTDARIAAVYGGVKLKPDQEKLWPPVEAAVRGFAKLRIYRVNDPMDAELDDDQQDPDGSGARRGDAVLNDAPMRRFSGPVRAHS